MSRHRRVQSRDILQHFLCQGCEQKSCEDKSPFSHSVSQVMLSPFSGTVVCFLLFYGRRCGKCSRSVPLLNIIRKLPFIDWKTRRKTSASSRQCEVKHTFPPLTQQFSQGHKPKQANVVAPPGFHAFFGALRNMFKASQWTLSSQSRVESSSDKIEILLLAGRKVQLGSFGGWLPLRWIVGFEILLGSNYRLVSKREAAYNLQFSHEISQIVQRKRFDFSHSTMTMSAIVQHSPSGERGQEGKDQDFTEKIVFNLCCLGSMPKHKDNQQTTFGIV